MLGAPSAARLLLRPPMARALAAGARGGVARRGEHIDAALDIVRAYAVARYDESVDISLVLNSDYKRSDERVRGSVTLPPGWFLPGGLVAHVTDAADVIGRAAQSTS